MVAAPTLVSPKARFFSWSEPSRCFFAPVSSMLVGSGEKPSCLTTASSTIVFENEVLICTRSLCSPFTMTSVSNWLKAFSWSWTELQLRWPRNCSSVSSAGAGAGAGGACGTSAVAARRRAATNRRASARAKLAPLRQLVDRQQPLHVVVGRRRRDHRPRLAPPAAVLRQVRERRADRIDHAHRALRIVGPAR